MAPGGGGAALCKALKLFNHSSSLVAVAAWEARPLPPKEENHSGSADAADSFAGTNVSVKTCDSPAATERGVQRNDNG